MLYEVITAKTAFRTQVKQHHPDRFAAASQEVRVRQTERFREIHQAYHLLNDYLATRHRSSRPVAHGARSYRSARQSRTQTAPPGTERTTLPPLPLEFGLFAFYSGKIDYRDLIAALVWQCRQRPAIGTLA